MSGLLVMSGGVFPYCLASCLRRGTMTPTAKHDRSPARCRADPGPARRRSARRPGDVARARAGVVGAGPRRLAGDAAGPVHRGHARRGPVHGRRSPLLDRPGGRARACCRSTATSTGVIATRSRGRSSGPTRVPDSPDQVERRGADPGRAADACRSGRDPARPGRAAGGPWSSSARSSCSRSRPAAMLGWYDEIVAAVDRVSAGGEIGPAGARGGGRARPPRRRVDRSRPGRARPRRRPP